MLFNSSRHLVGVIVLLLACWCSGCTQGSGDKGSTDSSPKFTQYYNRGEQLYLQHCSNCHQKNGSGLGLLFPPLNKSDYLKDNLDAVLCLMRYGKSGEIIVNGQSFNKEMKGIPTLSDLEIAEIATYIYNTWENKQGMIEVGYVSTVLQTCETGSTH